MNFEALAIRRAELFSLIEAGTSAEVAFDLQLEIDSIDFKLHAENLKNRMKINIEAFANGEFEADHEHKKKIIEYFTSTSRYSLMYGPTQAGKTASSFELVRTAMNLGLITIVSTDNRSDQLEQMYNRYTVSFSSVAAFSDIGIFKITEKKIGRKIARYKKNCYFCYE